MLITCTLGLNPAKVTRSELLIWYGPATRAPDSDPCWDPELEVGADPSPLGWGVEGGSGLEGVSPGTGMWVLASWLRTVDREARSTSLALQEKNGFQLSCCTLCQKRRQTLFFCLVTVSACWKPFWFCGARDFACVMVPSAPQHQEAPNMPEQSPKRKEDTEHEEPSALQQHKMPKWSLKKKVTHAGQPPALLQDKSAQHDGPKRHSQKRQPMTKRLVRK